MVSTDVGFCPHCGNTTPQSLKYFHEFHTYGFHADGSKTEDELPAAYYIASCGTCNDILLYYSEIQPVPRDMFIYADLIWPKEEYLPATVPERVRNFYLEAARIKRIAPNAFAVQIRRGIEAVCDDRGIKQGPLNKRLKQLSSKGELPTLLSDMTNILRIVGNIGAHSSEREVRPIQVNAIDEFFRAIVEYVYVAPGKLEAFRNRLSELR